MALFNSEPYSEEYVECIDCEHLVHIHFTARHYKFCKTNAMVKY